MSPLPREDFERAVPPELVGEFTELNPFGGEDAFFQAPGAVLSLALVPADRLIWITGVFGGGLEWLWDLQRFGLSNGYEQIGFKVKRGSPWGRAVVRFSKARLMAETPSGDEYCASMRAR